MTSPSRTTYSPSDFWHRGRTQSGWTTVRISRPRKAGAISQPSRTGPRAKASARPWSRTGPRTARWRRWTRRARDRPPAGVLAHADRGRQYAACEYQTPLARYGMAGSMRRTGHCYDNAWIASWPSLIPKELIYLSNFHPRDAARLAVFGYIEIFYNRPRLHSALGYWTPWKAAQQAFTA
jgi:putative transposase